MAIRLIVGSICVRFRLPVIAGYILAGLFIGPFGAGLIGQVAQIKVLAELGVALLLFSLGVELSIRKVFAAAGRVTIAALCQIVFTVTAAAVLALVFKLVPSIPAGIIFGFICALSSTAIITKLLVDRAETETLHGRVLIPILLIQDLSLVPVVALLPAFAQSSERGLITALIYALVKSALLIATIIAGAVFVVPRLLATVSKSNSRELFLLTTISLCLVVALISNQLGVSLALGAFLSGIMVSERPFGHRVLVEIMPLRDLFSTLFFASIGMLLDPVFIVAHWVQVLIFVLLLIIGKAIIAGLSAILATRSLWSAILVGIGLAQIGEFSFVLATLAQLNGLLPDAAYNLFFAGAVVTLAISPALTAMAPPLLAKLPRFRLLRQTENVEGQKSREKNHLILCGFGRMGRNLGLTLQTYRVPFTVIDLNGDVVQELESRGIKYIYGDAFNHLVLKKANLRRAECLVVTIPDAMVALNVINYARTENPDIRIIARVNRAEDLDLFRKAGANAVVQPEFEASLESTKMALISMHRPRREIVRALRDLRQRGYMIFRPELAHDNFVEFPHENYIGVWFVYKSASEQTIHDLDIRKHSGVTILAVKRGAQLIPHPNASLRLRPNDELYIAGDEQQLEKFERIFSVVRFCPTTEIANGEF